MEMGSVMLLDLCRDIANCMMSMPHQCTTHARLAVGIVMCDANHVVLLQMISTLLSCQHHSWTD